MSVSEDGFGSDSRNSVAIPHGGTWVADTMGDEGATFLLSIERNGDHMGWKVGKLSAVLDSISDRAYAEAIGEDSDMVNVFVLTTWGPVPVGIVSKGHPSIGLVQHVVSWRDRRADGKRWDRSEDGFTKIIDI